MSILSGIQQLFKSPFDHGEAHKLYVSIVQQARLAVFYEDFEVCDTMEGRFDLVTVHTYLVLRRLRDDHETTGELAQALFDLMFADFDENLRELGYGDTGVAKRIKKMVQGFYGRIKVYDQGLDAEESDSSPLLERALDRNLYRETSPSPDAVSAMAGYVRTQAAHLAEQDINALMAGRVMFSTPERRAGE